MSVGRSDAEIAAREQKEIAVLTLLGELSLNYWRPDFTQEQARGLYRSYVEDLCDYPIREIAASMQEYRKDGANRFFPTSGQLIDLMLGKDELERENPGAPDRARTLHRVQGELQNRSATEIKEFTLALEARAAEPALRIAGTAESKIPDIHPSSKSFDASRY